MTDFSGKRAEFELLADGEKFNLTEAEGGNADGNIVLPVGTGQGGQTWTVTLDNLPKTKKVKNAQNEDVDQAIVWTIREVSATYRVGDGADTAVSGDALTEHFTINYATSEVDPDPQAATTEKIRKITCTNARNPLTTVKIVKRWSDATGENAVDHTDDEVYFDLYRTTATTLPASGAASDYAQYATAENLVYADIALNAKSSPAWTYQNSLMEKFGVNGAPYHYFVIEHSVAGYAAGYAIVSETSPSPGQTVTITNAPTNRKGKLTLSKVVSGGPTSLDKTYRFTLSNSGKYLSNALDGTWAADAAASIFSVKPGTPVTIENVPEGEYVLTEITDAAWIGGYKFNAVAVSVNGSETVAISQPVYDDAGELVKETDCVTPTGIAVTGATGNPPTTAVAVTNTYEQVTMPKTSFSFGKLWVIPDANETTTLVWPDSTSVTMRVYSRKKGTTENVTLVGEYVLTKAVNSTIGSNVGDTAETTNVVNITPNPANANYPVLSQQHTDFINRNNHYSFVFDENLPQYDENGNELESHHAGQLEQLHLRLSAQVLRGPSAHLCRGGGADRERDRRGGHAE